MREIVRVQVGLVAPSSALVLVLALSEWSVLVVNIY